MRDGSTQFSDLACWADFGEARPVTLGELGFGAVQFASGNYFRTLGVRAAIGRTIEPHDDGPETWAPVAMIGHRFWQRVFGGRSGRHQQDDQAERPRVRDRRRDSGHLLGPRSRIDRGRRPADRRRRDCRADRQSAAQSRHLGHVSRRRPPARRRPRPNRPASRSNARSPRRCRGDAAGRARTIRRVSTSPTAVTA